MEDIFAPEYRVVLEKSNDDGTVTRMSYLRIVPTDHDDVSVNIFDTSIPNRLEWSMNGSKELPPKPNLHIVIHVEGKLLPVGENEVCYTAGREVRPVMIPEWLESE